MSFLVAVPLTYRDLAVEPIPHRPAMTGSLDAIHQLARSPHGYDELGGDVLDAARLVTRDDLHGLESTQWQVELETQSRIDGIPQLRLEADDLAEQSREVDRAPMGTRSASSPAAAVRSAAACEVSGGVRHGLRSRRLRHRC